MDFVAFEVFNKRDGREKEPGHFSSSPQSSATTNMFHPGYVALSSREKMEDRRALDAFCLMGFILRLFLSI